MQLVGFAVLNGQPFQAGLGLIGVDLERQSRLILCDQSCVSDRLVQLEIELELRAFDGADAACVFDLLFRKASVFRVFNFRISPLHAGMLEDGHFVFGCLFIGEFDVVKKIGINFGNAATKDGIVQCFRKRNATEAISAFSNHQRGFRRQRSSEAGQNYQTTSPLHFRIARSNSDFARKTFAGQMGLQRWHGSQTE